MVYKLFSSLGLKFCLHVKKSGLTILVGTLGLPTLANTWTTRSQGHPEFFKITHGGR